MEVLSGPGDRDRAGWAVAGPAPRVLAWVVGMGSSGCGGLARALWAVIGYYGGMARGSATLDKVRGHRKNNAADVARRKRDVERAMMHMPWTLETQHRLGELHGVSARQIREDAKSIRALWAEQITLQNIDQRRADWLARVHAAQHEARKDRQHNALTRLLRLEANVSGLDNPLQVEVTHKAEQLAPIEQARAIVDNYDAAKAYLEAAEPLTIEADYEPAE